MAGYNRNDTPNNIATGNIINASDLDGEFDAIDSAFSEVSGHTHGGTSGDGAPITVLGPSQDVTISSSAILPKATNEIDLGSDAFKFKNLKLSGTATLGTLDVTTLSLGETPIAFKSGASGDNSVSGDVLGGLNCTGYDGTNYVSAATIRAKVDGTPGTNDMPGRLEFLTTADGASTPTERLRISNAGGFSFGSSGTAYGTAGQVLVSNGNAPPAWSSASTGTVTSVGGTGTVNGLTLTGTVTSTGNLTLGGTLSNVNLTSQVTGTLPVANGGTGQTTATAAINALLPSQTGNTGKVLSTNGTSASWTAVEGGGGGTVTAVTGVGPITSTEGTAPAIGISHAGGACTTTTGQGALVFGTSPTLSLATLTYPTLSNAVLGTPISVSLTNATDLPLGTAVTGVLATNNGGTGTTTSTGTGSTVRSTSPTLVTPVLGTPQSGSLVNCTGVSLTTGVAGTLPILNGGTNSSSSPTAGGVSYGSGTAFAFTPAGTSGQLLSANGSSAPSWVAPGSLSVSFATTAGTATSATSATSATTAGTCTGNAATATNPQGGGTFITSSNIGSQSVSFANAANSATNASNLTGTGTIATGVTATTQTAGSNNTRIATTAYVDNAPSITGAKLTLPSLSTATVTPAGSSQGTATLIAADINYVTTSSTNTGVILPAVSATQVGRRIRIYCDGNNPLRIYPPVSSFIDNNAANAFISVFNGSYIDLVAKSTTLWVGYSNAISTAGVYSYSLSGTDGSGSQIRITTNDGTNTGGKTIRVSTFNDSNGTLEIINKAYSAAILSLNNSGDLAIAATASKPGGGSWADSSDSRLKSNQQPLTGALNKITALNPVSYSWKYASTSPTVGFIAQEVQQVMPNAVSETSPTEAQKPFIDDDKVLAIGWQNDMTAYLVGAIKELKAELDAAKAEIETLKAAG